MTAQATGTPHGVAGVGVPTGGGCTTTDPTDHTPATSRRPFVTSTPAPWTWMLTDLSNHLQLPATFPTQPRRWGRGALKRSALTAPVAMLLLDETTKAGQ